MAIRSGHVTNRLLIALPGSRFSTLSGTPPKRFTVHTAYLQCRVLSGVRGWGYEEEVVVVYGSSVW